MVALAARRLDEPTDELWIGRYVTGLARNVTASKFEGILRVTTEITRLRGKVLLVTFDGVYISPDWLTARAKFVPWDDVLDVEPRPLPSP